MKIIINIVLGLLLFVGALVGGLAATGRLNHEGAANIPVLGSFFPAPPEPKEGEGAEGKRHMVRLARRRVRRLGRQMRMVLRPESRPMPTTPVVKERRTMLRPNRRSRKGKKARGDRRPASPLCSPR